MAQDNWDSISREVVSLFTTISDEEPIYMICLDWNLICKGFLNDKGWTKWTNDGANLSVDVEKKTVGFIIFSRAGVHEFTYHFNKKPEIEHIFDVEEMFKFKVIKSRSDKLDLRLTRHKNFILGEMKYLETHSLKFDSDQWDYITLRQKIIVGRKLVKRSMKIEKDTRQVKVKSPTKTDKKTVDDKIVVRSKRRKGIKKPIEIIVDDYNESIKSARSDINSLKNRENRKLANNALEKMEEAVEIIKRCEKDVNDRNDRIKKLRREKIQMKSKPMRKLDKHTRLEELDRKIEMIDRMNEKELIIKTQKVTEFCGLREAILTIRTNEEKLSTKEINQLIDKALISEMQTEALEKALEKLKKFKSA
jgi:hypothetical protein